jgi:hypothetical protein
LVNAYIAFDFLILGTNAGIFPLTPMAAAQNNPSFPYDAWSAGLHPCAARAVHAVGDSAYYDNRNQGCTTWHLVYNSQGFSALNISFKSADDSGNGPGAFTNWGTSGGTLAVGTTLPLTATTSGQATGYKYRPFVKISITSVTGTGTIWPMLYGYRPGASGDASNGVPAIDSSGRLTVIGPGSGFGLAQAMPVFHVVNPIAAEVPTTVNLNAAVTTAINLKATGGELYALEIQNPNASLCFLQVFDVAQGSVTLGTTVPKISVPLLTSGEKYLGNIPFGLLFSGTALSMAATTTPNGATTCATGLVVTSWVQ